MNSKLLPTTFAFLVCALGASSLQAGYLTLKTEHLMGLGQTFEDPDSMTSALMFKEELAGGAVLYTGTLGSGFPRTGSPAAIGIGGSPADLLGTSDLTGADFYGLRITNTDNSMWDVAVYVETDDGLIVSDYKNTVPLSMGGHAVNVNLDLAGVDLSHVQEIGLIVRGRDWLEPGYPSDPDVFHIAAAPVPEPATLALLGIAAGAGGIGAARRRRKAKALANAAA